MLNISTIFDAINIKTSNNTKLDYIEESNPCTIKKSEFKDIDHIEKYIEKEFLKDMYLNIYKNLIISIKTDTISQIPGFDEVKTRIYNFNQSDNKVLDYLHSDIVITSIRLADLFLDHFSFKINKSKCEDYFTGVPYFIGTFNNKMIFVDPCIDYNSSTIFGFNHSGIIISLLNEYNSEILDLDLDSLQVIFKYKYRFNISNCKFVNYK